MRPSSKAMRTLALTTALAILGGCSEYLDRRETIARSGGNAVATNVVTHMVDPWPRESANRNIAFNGATSQAAFERYRTHRVIAPRGTGTSATYQEPAPGAAPSAPAGSAMTAPAAAVK